MPATRAEQALRRALDYLADSGLELEDATTAEVLSLVEEGMRECPDELLAWVMRRLPQRFDLSGPSLPPIQPALCRGSIGYPSGR